jgi:hypothetical protein
MAEILQLDSVDKRASIIPAPLRRLRLQLHGVRFSHAGVRCGATYGTEDLVSWSMVLRGFVDRLREP